MALNINEAVDLFMTLFNLSIWAVGFIAVAYVLGIMRLLASRVKQLRLTKR